MCVDVQARGDGTAVVADADAGADTFVAACQAGAATAVLCGQEGVMPKLFERNGDVVIADRVDPHAFDGKCEFCGQLDELRPFGPNNENICFDCGMKDEATTARKMREMLEGGN